MDRKIHQMDIKVVFLNVILEVKINMDHSEGFVQEGKEHLMCTLKKVLCGLKQSPRA